MTYLEPTLHTPLQDFDIRKMTSKWHKLSETEYEEKLRMLGEGILSITEDSTKPQKLSSTVIKEFCGDSFYQKYARTYSDRQNLFQQLIALDPKYHNIELQHQEQHRKPLHPLESFEIDCIETSLLDFLEQHNWQPSQHLPHGIYSHVIIELNALRQKKGLPTRTDASIRGHVISIWENNRKKYTFRRGSPTASAGITDQILMERMEKIAERQSTDTRLISNLLIEKDENNLRRDLYRRYSDEGHTNLVIFLMEPDNYSEFISKDVSLFKIDFNESEVDEILKEEYKEKMELLKTRREALSDEGGLGGNR